MKDDGTPCEPGTCPGCDLARVIFSSAEAEVPIGDLMELLIEMINEAYGEDTILVPTDEGTVH